ncbi:MAG: metal-dependent transcriptional regulator [Phycisphaerales bacterium]|nr:metal-dependent transcriptional regulator [Phycisphaerales bacterium]
MEVWKEFEQNVVTHSAAHHLMAIDDLIRKVGYARVSDIARELDITRGSVSISLRPLKDAGLIIQDDNRHLRLSPSGQALVDAIKTKRAVAQRLFHEFFGVDAEQAEIDACKLEHLISNQVAQRVLAFLRFIDSGDPAVCRFLQAWRGVDPVCNGTPETCPSCQGGCLAENVER